MALGPAAAAPDTAKVVFDVSLSDDENPVSSAATMRGLAGVPAARVVTSVESGALVHDWKFDTTSTVYVVEFASPVSVHSKVGADAVQVTGAELCTVETVNESGVGPAEAGVDATVMASGPIAEKVTSSGGARTPDSTDVDAVVVESQ